MIAWKADLWDRLVEKYPHTFTYFKKEGGVSQFTLVNIKQACESGNRECKVTMSSLDRLCAVLDCGIEDVLERIKED